MARLLHLKATPRGDDSRTMKLAAAFTEAYLAAHPGDTLDTVDLFTADLPPFENNAATGRYALLRGLPHTPEQAAAWQRVTAAIESFKSYDKYVITTPMWNFSIPWSLKLFLDTVIQPGYTFGYDPAKGFFGLMEGKPVQLLITRTGNYAPGSGAENLDFQLPYLRFILGFIGLELKGVVIAQALDMVPPEESARLLEAAIVEAKSAASAF